MKLLKTILLVALHGAHASHEVTKHALDAETTHRLAAEAATAGVVKLPGAVAKLFGRPEGAEAPVKQAQGPVEQHQDNFKAGHAPGNPGKVDIYYLGVAGPPAEFVLVDTKSGVEHRIPIEAGTHITYDNSVYEHRVDAHPDSKRTMLGPASLPSGGRRLEAVGGSGPCGGGQFCTPCCTGGEENCEVARCTSVFDECRGCPNAASEDECEDCCFGDTASCKLDRRKLRAGGRKALFAYPKPDVTPADGCCGSIQLTSLNGVKCRSELNDFLGTISTPAIGAGVNTCWNRCLLKYPDELAAIDWSITSGECYCQNDCECVTPIAGAFTFTRDSKVDARPSECTRRMLESHKSHK